MKHALSRPEGQALSLAPGVPMGIEPLGPWSALGSRAAQESAGVPWLLIAIGVVAILLVGALVLRRTR